MAEPLQLAEPSPPKPGPASPNLQADWEPRWLSPNFKNSRPPGCWGHTLSYSEGSLYVIGGQAKPSDSQGYRESEIIQVDTYDWSCRRVNTQGPSPVNRDSHTATVIGPKGRRQIIVFGGTDGHMKFNELHTLDLRTKMWTVSRPEGSPPERESHTATLIGNKVAVFGGSGYQEPAHGESNLEDPCYFNDLHWLDVDTLEWTTSEFSGKPPCPRDGHAAAALGDRLVIFGGDCGSDTYLSDVFMLETKTMRWTDMHNTSKHKPEPRVGHVMCPYKDGVLLFGGVNAEGISCHDCWVLRLGPSKKYALASDESCWKKVHCVGQPPVGRFAYAAGYSPDSLFIFGGLSQEMPMDDLHVLYFTEDSYIMAKQGRAVAAPEEQAPSRPCPTMSPTDINSCPGDDQGPTMSDAATPSGEYREREREVASQRPAKALDTYKEPSFAPGLPLPVSLEFLAARPSVSGLSQGGSRRNKSQTGEQHPREGKVTSYNMFCTAIRTRMKMERPDVPAREIERQIGQQWQQMTLDEKKQYEEAAVLQNARAAISEQNDEPSEAKREKKRQKDAQAEMEAKRAKFRAGSKNTLDQQSFNSKLDPKALLGGMAGGQHGKPPPSFAPSARPGGATFSFSAPGGLPPNFEPHGERSAGPSPPPFGMQDQEVLAPATSAYPPQPRLLGAPIEGTVDGLFNAGYLATVRLGGITYRAMLFSPVLTVASSEVAEQAPQQMPDHAHFVQQMQMQTPQGFNSGSYSFGI
mmetsp:Transcript_31767/g.90219  ORF Transcript_31767/g.90219 Transcript_31767/m.90219 type:complete len:748 (+) Transcript_31767:122-2365(+)